MIFADSHCHVDFDDYAEGSADIIAAARQAGVRYLLNVSVDPIHWQRVFDLALGQVDVYASVGVHPNQTVDAALEPNVEQLLTLSRLPKVVAIGETGLDYYRSGEDQRDAQQQRFRTHIRAAKAAQKPLIIHTRNAAEDTLRIMREEHAEQAGGVMHCFAENWAVAEQALAMNFYISFSGIVTFKSATALQEVAQKVPLNRILIETDSPYLAPIPYRGKTNQPAYVVEVARKLAELRAESMQSIAAQTTENFLALFRIH